MTTMGQPSPWAVALLLLAAASPIRAVPGDDVAHTFMAMQNDLVAAAQTQFGQATRAPTQGVVVSSSRTTTTKEDLLQSFIFSYPLVSSANQIMSQYRGIVVNNLVHSPALADENDLRTLMATPCLDVIYSVALLDLRDDAVVLCHGDIPSNVYFSAQVSAMQ